MQSFRHLPIKHKLAVIIMVTSTVVLLLASAAFITSEILSFRNSALRNATSVAGVIAASSRIPLLLKEYRTIEEALGALQAESSIRVGVIFDAADQPLARYVRSGENFVDLVQTSGQIAEDLPDILATGEPFEQFSGNFLEIIMPIMADGERIGAVYLRSDLTHLYLQLLRLGMAALLILGASFVLAILLSVRLQHFISGPILHLVEIMDRVSRERNYSLRGKRLTEDEIGSLIDGFNGMLSQIEARNRQLEEYGQEMEAQVRLRTSELQATNRELQQAIADLQKARDAAEAANETKSLFLANMSHEIRTPMTGVLGLTELLLKSGLNERQRGMAETAYRSGEALLELLNDILDFSKIEAGKLQLDAIPFDFLKILEEAAELLGEKARAKGLEVILDFAPGLPSLLIGDPGRLRQIVLNLLSNAIKFTDEGWVIVRARIAREKSRKILLEVEVEDSGIGIEPEIQKKIFDSFSQADNSTARRFGGTGLGLAISRELASLMGGGLEVQSVPEQGSTFRLTCQLKKAQGTGSSSPLAADLVGGQALVAAAEAHLRGAVGRQLEWLGMRVSEAADLRQLVAAVNREKAPALLLLDANLPGLSSSSGEKLQSLTVEPGRLILLEGEKLPLPTILSAGQTRTTLRKPLRPSILAAALSGAPPVPSETFEAQQSSKSFRGRVLIAEDTPSTRQLMQFVLERIGCQTQCVGNGEEALAILEGENFKLVLMDCRMPGMDGLEATRLARRRGFELPIIAITANTQRVEIDRCLAAGMNDFLAKPFRYQALIDLIDKWLPQPAPDLAELPAEERVASRGGRS